MAYKEFHYCWEYDLRAAPEQLWPFVADTNRFNYDAGVPAVQLPQLEGTRLENARRRLKMFVLGLTVEWEEQPFEWIKPYRFGVVRRYTRGPVAEVRVLCELQPRAEGGTHLVYEVWALPKSALGVAAIPAQIGFASKRNFERIFRRYDKLAQEGNAPPAETDAPNFAPGGKERLTALRHKLAGQGTDKEIVRRLENLLLHADDISLARLRPYALADYWDLPRRRVLETCLQATRAGMLDLQWDVLCPHCRGAKRSSKSLTGISSNGECETCNIDFTVNFDRLVELTFRPNDAIRTVKAREFCIGGPQVTPHVVVQQMLAPGEAREICLMLEAGRHRLRCLNLSGAQYLVAAEDGDDERGFTASDDGWGDDETALSLSPTLTFRNATDKEQLFILERFAWSDQAATAAEVTALQMFRDLFSNEALRPGEQISVGSLSVLFTDLKGSTQLYRDIGDAAAFGRVMSHFDVLRQAIADADGALVKTIGDAIMAVFRRPDAALRAILKAQDILANPTDGGLPLTLKVGIHAGPCIAVTLNDRLDYFGGTVNLAARLEGLSSGGDVVISESVHHDPAVQELLAEHLQAENFSKMLKGFGDEEFDLWRVAPRRDERFLNHCRSPHEVRAQFSSAEARTK
jgi:class 3 adenylate cyclase